MSSIESKITKSVFYQFFNLVVTGLTGVFFIPFIISSLGKEQYGIFEIAYSLNIINSVLDIGVGSTITNYAKKYFDSDEGKFSEFFWTFFWLKLFLSIIGLLICIGIAINVDFIFQKVSVENAIILKQVIIWFGVGVLIQNLNSFINGVVNGFVRFDMTSFSSISSKFIYIVGFFIWFYFGNLSIVDFSILTFVLIPFVKLFTQLVQIIIYIPEIISLPKRPKLLYIKDTLNYLGGISVVTISAQFFNYGAQAILSIVATPVLVGEFGILQRIIKLIKQISGMLVSPILPGAHDLRKKYSISKIVSIGTNIHAITVIGITFLILINSEVISIYFLNSVYPNFSLHLLMFGVQMLIPSFVLMLMLYYSEGKTKMSIQFNLFNTTISITLAYVGIVYYNLTGFITGLTIGYAISVFGQLYRYLKYYNLDIWKFLKIYINIYIYILILYLCHLGIYLLFDNQMYKVIISNMVVVSMLGIFAWKNINTKIRNSILKKFKLLNS